MLVLSGSTRAHKCLKFCFILIISRSLSPVSKTSAFNCYFIILPYRWILLARIRVQSGLKCSRFYLGTPASVEDGPLIHLRSSNSTRRSMQLLSHAITPVVTLSFFFYFFFCFKQCIRHAQQFHDVNHERQTVNSLGDVKFYV